jgi:hypothetical protein
MADPPNHELMRQITEDPYFQSLTERQVRQRVNEQLDQTRKVLVPALLILVIAGGLYGFTSIKDLNDKKKELDSAINQVLKQATDVAAVSEDLRRKSEAAKTKFELYDQAAGYTLGTFKEATVQSLQSIQRTHDDLTKEIAKFDDTQSKASDKARALLDQLNNEGNKLNATKNELNAVAEKAEGEVSRASTIRGDLAAEQQRFRRANADLLKATQVQYILIHSDSERALTAYAAKPADAADANPESVLTEYRFKFETKKVRPGSKVRIAVIQGKDGKPGSSSDYPLAEGVREQIEGTPFDYEVQFIYHATIVTHHFAVIRVFPHEGVASQ